MTLMRTTIYGLLAAAALAGPAAAQSIDSYSASFNAGWGRNSGDESRGFRPKAGRDANGNRLIVDGIIQTGADQSSYAHSETGGAFDSGSGAGFGGGNTAIGNNLSVNVIGNWNTVIVDSTQINNGDVIAGGRRAADPNELNGGVDLND